MRICKSCGDPINGRSDKIFCSSTCKSQAFRQKQLDMASHIQINKILKHNYVIIHSLFGNSKKLKVETDHLTLAQAGFQFDYCTKVYQNNQGKWYRYIYEYRWMQFSDQSITIYRSKKK